MVKAPREGAVRNEPVALGASDPRARNLNLRALWTPGGWILVLIFIFTIWNPATLALHASSTVWNLNSRSTLSIVFLAARLAITSVGVAAGIALWLRRPGAVWLAKLALILFGIEAVARLSTRVDLSSAPPGTRLPIALFVVVHNAGWYLYLQLSRRVTAAYGLESHS